MARRRQVAVQEEQSTQIEESAPEAAAAVMEAPNEERPTRQWRENPFPIDTVNLGGYKIVLQESRPDKESRKDRDKPSFDEQWQMQIRFGSGGKDDMPPEKVLDYLKSLTKTVTTKEGEENEPEGASHVFHRLPGPEGASHSSTFDFHMLSAPEGPWFIARGHSPWDSNRDQPLDRSPR
jgi:hypothetical protein